MLEYLISIDLWLANKITLCFCCGLTVGNTFVILSFWVQAGLEGKEHSVYGNDVSLF